MRRWVVFCQKEGGKNGRNPDWIYRENIYAELLTIGYTPGLNNPAFTDHIKGILAKLSAVRIQMDVTRGRIYLR